MDERDGLIICALIALLTAGSILHSRMLGLITDKIVRQDEELAFLRATMTAMSERTE